VLGGSWPITVKTTQVVEGALASGCDIWLRDVGTAKSGLVLERWWVDHRLRTVVISGDEHEHERARKGSGKGKANKGGAVFSEEDREFFYFFSYFQYVTECQ
jgi:hypothetical protein